MNGMGIIGLIVKNEPVPLAFLKCSRLGLFIKAPSVDRPAIEACLAAIDLPENKRDRFFRILDCAALPKPRAVPQLLLRFHPARSTTPVSVLHDNSHSISAIVVLGCTQDPSQPSTSHEYGQSAPPRA